MKPELLSLSWINWQLFCTFTFKKERMPAAIRQSMFFGLLRKEADNYGVHFKKLIWCLRAETGETAGRFHYHALIAGLPGAVLTERTCRATESIWKSMGGGFAVVRIYSPFLDGVDYILKGLAEAQERMVSANYYEFNKFGRDSEITLSKSILGVIEGRRQIGKRSRPAQRKAE